MKAILEQLLASQDLTRAQSAELLTDIMSGRYNDSQIAALLVALRAKGETSDEIAGFAEAMRSKMARVTLSVDAIDMCGTGGDGTGTFNISTAASFVVAGAGVPVAKHGNRAISSKAGSADVLSALGVPFTDDPARAGAAIDQIGIGFLFAPSFHPAMKYVMPARSALAIRTVFNVLGPLCNPAGVQRQVIGVFDRALTSQLASVLHKLGSVRAMVVHGNDGLDEITTTTTTQAVSLDGAMTPMTIDPEALGIPLADPAALKGGDADTNARIVMGVLNGGDSPQSDIVCLNAAAGILVGGKVRTMADGLAMARESLKSGAARDKLEQLKTF